MDKQIRYSKLRSVDEESRTADFIISDESRDRHNTVLKIDRWNIKNYDQNPIFGYQHEVYGSIFGGSNPDTIIGKAVKVFREGSKLIGRFWFETKDINELADKLWKKVKAGTLRAVSVGFMPILDKEGKEGQYGEGDEARGGPNETFYFNGQELLEVSLVHIPSNANAIKRQFENKQERVMEFIKKELGEDYLMDDVEQEQEKEPEQKVEDLEPWKQKLYELKLKLVGLE